MTPHATSSTSTPGAPRAKEYIANIQQLTRVDPSENGGGKIDRRAAV